MIGRTNAGGGGGGLNFKVVGGTSQPVNPKENTIWVNTETEISGWAFSATEPGSPVEGMVWIYTGTYSTKEFNALKKNCVNVYPLSAKQYISGSLVSKKTKIYQNGTWREFIDPKYILNAESQSISDVSSQWSYEYSPQQNFGKTSDGAYFSLSQSSGGEPRTFYAKTAIDVTKYSILEVYGYTKTSKATNRFGLLKSKSGSSSAFVVSKQFGTSAEVLLLDISSLSGYYYPAFETDHNGGAGGDVIYFKYMVLYG